MADKMILALGEFVTAVGEVEYVMFETILAVAEEAANDVHRAFYKETFGPKVEMLAKRLEHSAFDEHRAGVDHLIGMLRKLTSQRNNIIHGETFYITRGAESKIFRVGFTGRIQLRGRASTLGGTRATSSRPNRLVTQFRIASQSRPISTLFGRR